MLFKQRFLSGIRAGAGGTLKTAVGVLAIESVEPIAESAVTVAAARRAGYSSRDELIAELHERRRACFIA